MSRDYRVYLEDMIEAAGKIRRYMSGLSFEAFCADDKTVDAVIRNLEVIGEAAKKVPQDIRSRAPDIDWKRIAGLRDVLIHEYFGVNLSIVWDIIQVHLPSLERALLELGTDAAPSAEGSL